MHVLEVRHLRLITAVTERGGITAAARALHITQPALSRQLTELEARLGVALFARVGRRLVITKAGERLLACARRVLGEMDAVERELTSGEYAGAAGLVRVATECYTNYHWLPSVLVAFREHWPRVDVRIVPEATARPLPALLDGTLDVAVVHRVTDQRGLQFTPLFDDEMVVVVPPEHRFAHLPAVLPEAIRDEHLILYSTSGNESSIIANVLRPAGVEPRQLSRIQLTEAILELVRAGLGITILSRWAVERHVASGTLAAVPLTSTGYRRRWYAATRTDVRQPPYLAQFLALLADSRFLPVEMHTPSPGAAKRGRRLGLA
jgi:LysR family transcriptional regulator, regulator for metE and metH